MIQSCIDCASDSEETTLRWFIVHYLWYILGWWVSYDLTSIALNLGRAYNEH